MSSEPEIYVRTRKIIPIIYHERILRFLEEMEPRAADFLKDDTGCIVEIGSGALYYASFLRAVLASRGRDISYATFDKHAKMVYKGPVKGRKIIGVDDGISSGNAYRAFREAFDPLLEKGDITDWRYAVENNLLADEGNFENVWSVRSEPMEEHEMRELSLGSVIKDIGGLIAGVLHSKNGGKKRG